MQGLNRHFLEVDLRPGMILQTDVAGLWPRPTIRINRAWVFWWNCLTLGEVCDLYSVEVNHSMRPIDGDLERIPLAAGLERTCQSLGKRVEHAGTRVVVGPVADFNFVTAVDRHPGFRRLFRYANEDPRVCLLSGQFKDHAEFGMPNLFSGIPKHPHPTLGPHHAIFHPEGAGTYLLPAIKIFSVKESLRGFFRADRNRKRYQHKADGYSTDIAYTGHGTASVPWDLKKVKPRGGVHSA